MLTRKERFERYKRNKAHHLKKWVMRARVKYNLPFGWSLKKQIFHGGCLTCVSQTHNPLKRCLGCKYFEANWHLPDLSIDSKEHMKNAQAEYERKLRTNKIDNILQND